MTNKERNNNLGLLKSDWILTGRLILLRYKWFLSKVQTTSFRIPRDLRKRYFDSFSTTVKMIKLFTSFQQPNLFWSILSQFHPPQVGKYHPRVIPYPPHSGFGTPHPPGGGGTPPGPEFRGVRRKLLAKREGCDFLALSGTPHPPGGRGGPPTQTRKMDPKNRHGTPKNRHGTPKNRHGTPKNRHGTPKNRHGTPKN